MKTKTKKQKNKNLEKGYTLVELLAVMIVLAALGTILGSIIISVFRGTNKTNAITVVRQNGNFAINQMSKMIRNAKRFEGVSEDGVIYEGTCVLPSVGAGTPTPTPKQYKYLQIVSFENDARVTFSCRAGSGTNAGYIASSSASITSSGSITNEPLIDTNQVSLNPIDASSCYFICSQDSLAQDPILYINFDLSTKSELGSTTFLENKSGILNFQTTIHIRH